MGRLSKAAARLRMTTAKMCRPNDPLSAAGADARRIRAVDRQDRELTTLATHDNTIHAYTCCREGKTRRDTTQLRGELQPTERLDATSTRRPAEVLAMRTLKGTRPGKCEGQDEAAKWHSPRLSFSPHTVVNLTTRHQIDYTSRDSRGGDTPLSSVAQTQFPSLFSHFQKI